MPGSFGSTDNEDGVVGTCTVSGKSGVFGFNPTLGGNGVAGISQNGNGVFAKSETLNGVFGESGTGIGVHGHSINHIGVFGVSDKDSGIIGVARAPGKAGVLGRNESADSEAGAGVVGDSGKGDGINGFAHAPNRNGVFGRNDPDPGFPDNPAVAPGGNGVFGFSMVKGGAGVFGANNRTDSGRGVQGNGAEAGVGGFSETGVGVLGDSRKGDGVSGFAHAPNKNGLLGVNVPDPGSPDAPAVAPGGNGVFGFTKVKGGIGVFGANDRTDGGRGVQGNGAEAGVGGFSEAGVGVLAESRTGNGILARGGKTAGRFEGNVDVTGTIHCQDLVLLNEDCAEEFDIAALDAVDPGSVMVIDQEGVLRQSEQAYDKRVAGVVSGAGEYKPAVVLGKRPSSGNRAKVALVGKVYCKVDAQYAPIGVGDLLTTSPTPGHAMKATNPLSAFGAVIGKALRPLQAGQGMIPILVALQ